MSFMNLHKQPPIDLCAGEKYPWPTRVSLETQSDCNRRCGFCPVSTGRRDFREQMHKSIITHVTWQLAEIGFDGVLQLFLLNEPTLDKRLMGISREIREMLPDATLYVSTNGDVIEKNPDYLPELYKAGVNVVNLNVYDDGPDQYKRFYEIAQDMMRRNLADWTDHKYSRHNPRRQYVTLTDMRPSRVSASSIDMFYTKNAEDKKDFEPIKAHCARPHRHLVVMHDGRVPLCCATDPTAPDLVIAGDLNTQTIDEVWNGEIMNKYRWHLQQKDRSLPNCSTCRHKMSYPAMVRHVRPTEEQLKTWQAR